MADGSERDRTRRPRPRPCPAGAGPIERARPTASNDCERPAPRAGVGSVAEGSARSASPFQPSRWGPRSGGGRHRRDLSCPLPPRPSRRLSLLSTSGHVSPQPRRRARAGCPPKRRLWEGPGCSIVVIGSDALPTAEGPRRLRRGGPRLQRRCQPAHCARSARRLRSPCCPSGGFDEASSEWSPCPACSETTLPPTRPACSLHAAPT